MVNETKKEEFLKIKAIVENPDFKVAKDVEVFFEAYTKYIWDYKMIGAIYDHYLDETIIHGPKGVNMTNIQDVMDHTSERLLTVPDLEINFIAVYAQKYSDDEFKFVQVTYGDATHTGPSKYGPPTGRKVSYDNMMSLCECLVQRVNGRWCITEEWGSIGYQDFFNGK